MKERVRQVQLQRVEQLLLADVPRGRQHHHHHVKQGWMDQKLDHFNHQANRTFPQVALPTDTSSADCIRSK